ncbi:MAG: peptidoglycan DD-metalloendopeptidase family protein [bacterium]|nr:peptidoglycan DD-metalloendopeptidase family protein [bacterium]
MHVQRIGMLAAGALVLIGGGMVIAREPEVGGAALHEVQETSRRADVTLDWDAVTVGEGDTFAAVMERIGVSYADTLAMVAAAEDVFDFTMIRLGRAIRYEVRDGVLTRLAYDIDTEEYVLVERTGDGFAVRRDSIPYEVTRVTGAGTIATSLYADGLASGMPEAAVIALATAFEWTIDFATQVQPGDTFRVRYETRTRNGAEAGIGSVLAAEFVNSGKRFTAYRFVGSNGAAAYFDAEGDSLARQLLRAPLPYGRVTSGFTYARFHPTLGRTTPHRAIDYAAPIGTPVRSTGAGTVTAAGWNGGYGNSIAVRHNETYETHYAHLSGYAKGIRRGASVAQGQTIGYVGSTGFSTGPHLHYEIAKWGTLINPLTLELPPVEPVADDRRAAFTALRDALDAELAE